MRKDEIESLRHQLDERDERLQLLAKQNREQEERIRELEQAWATQARRLEYMEQLLRATQKRLAEAEERLRIMGDTYYFAKHSASSADNPPLPRHPCSLCGKVFLTMEVLAHHEEFCEGKHSTAGEKEPHGS